MLVNSGVIVSGIWEKLVVMLFGLGIGGKLVVDISRLVVIWLLG